jgi:hypothetical protein
MKSIKKQFEIKLDEMGSFISSETTVFVLIWLVLFESSCFLYIADANHPVDEASSPLPFHNLAVAMNHSRERDAISSKLLQDDESTAVSSITEDFSDSISRRLSKRFAIQVFLSCSLSHVKESQQLLFIERNIVNVLNDEFVR